MAKNENRKKFLKNAGILGLAGIFGLSKMGNMPVVKAAVSDNAVAEDISKDIIRCSSSGVFTSGETAEDLADAVNGLNDSFSSALTDLKATDVATFVGAQGNTFTTVIEKLKSILQTKETTATTSAQTITPDSGKVLKSVKVNPQKHSGTLDKSSAFVSEIDLGELHNYRKVKTKVPSGTKEITSNGTTNIAGYESVKVNVSASITSLSTLVSNDNVNTTYNLTADADTIGWLVLDNFNGGGFQQAQIRSLTTSGKVITTISDLGGATICPNYPKYLTLIKCKQGDTLTYTAREGLEWNNGINGYVHSTVFCRIYAIKK